VSSTKFALEHFYYGQLVHHGAPVGDTRLLAKSAGVSEEHIHTALQQLPLPPLEGAYGAWALVRAKPIPFLMAQAQIGSAGQTIWHYIIMPGEAVRATGGNLRAMGAVLLPEMLPTFEMLGDKLPPVELPQTGAPSKEEQIEGILELMTDTNNRMPIIESLLAGIVQGVPMIVVNAPEDLLQRVGFVEGLLGLLPASVRYGVTFATHTLPDTPLDAQIRFSTEAPSPEEAVIYNWQNHDLSGVEVEDEYSHFIISQLRLDTEIVIQQTQALTAVAGWRIRQGDRLAEAMGYASHRFKLDNALLSNQPVEIADVSNVLAVDPTLTDDLRVTYARHVLNFALALGEMDYAEPLAVLVADHPDLAQFTLQQLGEAVKSGNANLIYQTLLNWMENPLGPKGKEWINLTHNTALFYLQALVKEGDLEAIHEFLDNTQSASPATQIGRVVPKIIEMALPLAGRDSVLSKKLFLLAMTHLENEPLKRLFNVSSFVTQLPKPVAALQPYLTAKAQTVAPKGALTAAAHEFDEEWQPTIILRLAQLAQANGRSDVLDTGALLQVALTRKPEGGADVLTPTQSLLPLVKSLDASDMDDLSARQHLQILLVLGEYADVAHGMIQQARERYIGDLQPKYVEMAHKLFAQTPLSAEEALSALQVLQDAGLKGVPMMMASVGALEATNWSPAMAQVADYVNATLQANPDFLEVIHTDAPLALLRYYVEHEDVANAIRVAGFVPVVAAYHEARGLAAISRMYQLMSWDERARTTGLQLLRRYIRKADDNDARKAVISFGRELGDEVRRTLEVTYGLKQFMGNMSLTHFAPALNATAEFLQDTAAGYIGRGTTSALNAMMDSLEQIAGFIAREQRLEAANWILSLGRAIVALGKGKRTKNFDVLLAGKADPQSGLDVFYMMGGYFAKGKRFALKLEPRENPLGNHAEPDFGWNLMDMEAILSGAARAFPPDKPLKLTAEELRDELDSMWGDLTTGQQRGLLRGLAADLQRVGDLIAQISDQGDAKALEEGGLAQKIDAGKQRPRSALELYRLMYAFIKSRA
jgi:hypothetical protein